MNYSEIKKHVIGKSYFLNYSTRIFIFLILCYLIYIYKNIIFVLQVAIPGRLILTLLFLWMSTMSLYYVMINLHRCRNFYKFYINNLKEYDVHFCKIVVEKEDYKMHVPNGTSATIHPSPKSMNAVYLETDDYFLLFFAISYFGLFQEVLKPFIFVKTAKEFYTEDKKVKVIRDFKTIETEENRTLIFPNNYGITKVIIPLQIPRLKQENRAE